MSSELDEVARALFNGQIPAIWRKLAPDTLKSLGNWMIHFKRRYNQYSSWVRRKSNIKLSLRQEDRQKDRQQDILSQQKPNIIRLRKLIHSCINDFKMSVLVVNKKK